MGRVVSCFLFFCECKSNSGDLEQGGGLHLHSRYARTKEVSIELNWLIGAEAGCSSGWIVFVPMGMDIILNESGTAGTGGFGKGNNWRNMVDDCLSGKRLDTGTWNGCGIQCNYRWSPWKWTLWQSYDTLPPLPTHPLTASAIPIRTIQWPPSEEAKTPRNSVSSFKPLKHSYHSICNPLAMYHSRQSKTATPAPAWRSQ